jgi:pimeloyl-ACP methyl ester carboxylesterase
MFAAAGFRAVAVNPRGVSESTGALEGLTLYHFAADRPDLVRSVILLAAGGLVGPAPETHAPFQRLLRQDISEAARLELMKAVYLSPASDPRVLLQVEQWPAVAAAQIAASQATPPDDW